MIKKYTIIAFIVLLIATISLVYRTYFTNDKNINPGIVKWDVCIGMINIYNKSLWNNNEFDYCTSESGENYLRIKSFWIEWWSWVNYYNIDWKNIWSISQYWEGNGTIPKNPTIVGRIFDDKDICEKRNIKECWVISLQSSYRWKEWLIKDSEYAKTCEQTIDKFWLNPNLQSTDGDSMRWELSNRIFMCTDNKDIFYVLFTGTKMWDERSATYQNYRTIEYFNMEGVSLWLTTWFTLKLNGQQLHGINILDENVPYKIESCIYMPIYDCYE